MVGFCFYKVFISLLRYYKNKAEDECLFYHHKMSSMMPAPTDFESIISEYLI